MSGGDAAEVFETAERVLNEVAGTLPVLVVADCAFAVSSPRNDGNHSCVTGRAAQPVGIIAFVGEKITHSVSTFEERGRCFYVADVASGQHQRIGAADDIGERMDLGRPATARPTDRLDLAPPFPSKAARCAWM